MPLSLVNFFKSGKNMENVCLEIAKKSSKVHSNDSHKINSNLERKQFNFICFVSIYCILKITFFSNFFARNVRDRSFLDWNVSEKVPIYSGNNFFVWQRRCVLVRQTFGTLIEYFLCAFGTIWYTKLMHTALHCHI